MLCGDTASAGQRETGQREGRGWGAHGIPTALPQSRYPALEQVRVPAGRSGAGLRQGVVGPGDTLCVGDSGRLSLEDSE